MNRATLVSLGLLGAALVAAQTVPSYKDLKYPPLPQVKIPTPEQITLSNGMRVFLLEDHELPLVRGLALVRTGNLFDPPEKRGLADITADVLRSGGTKSKTGDQIDELLESMAASVESSMDETSASLSFSALKENADTVLAVFKEVISEPEFRQDKLDLVLTQTRSAIGRRNDEASAIPDRELAAILYGRDTPYGWQIEYEHLNRIKRDDLIQFYQRYYFPKNIMLAVYGDFKAAEMREKLEKLFAGWKAEQAQVPAFPSVTAKPAPGEFLAQKEDVTQTFFSLGLLGGTLRDKDYAALQVAANILGQGFSSRLVREIRTKLGYAYDISAVWSANYNHPGVFRISGSTKSASTTETIQAIGNEIDKIRSTPVTAEELETAKQGAINSFVFNFDSPAKTLSRVMRYEYFGYPKDFLFEYQKAVATVTAADVQRAAQQRFRPENMSIVVVGNPKEFGKALTTLGKVTPIDLTIPEPRQASTVADAASLARGSQLLKRAQQAAGGVEKLAAVKDTVQSVDMAMTAEAGGLKMKQRNRWLAPSYFRQEQDLPFGKVVAYTDGKTGWLSTPQGFLPMPPQILKQAQGELLRMPLHLLLADQDKSVTVNGTGENTIEVIAADGLSVKVEFEPATGLPAKESYREAGAPDEVQETFSDWRDAGGGVKLPYRFSITQGGKKIADASVQEYKLNTGVKLEELSEKPPQGPNPFAPPKPNPPKQQ